MRIALALIACLAATAAQARDIQTAIFAGGCFWCVEADMDKIKGVISTTSGFTGGTVADPSYKQVTGGKTGHYEAVKVEYDADKVSYAQLVNAFFRSVDPTDAGGQFCDRGDAYRTAVFTANAAERQIAEAAKKAARAALGQKIVTPILATAPFYPASAYHQDYYKQSRLIVTRFGPLSKAKAYKRYRSACGRDAGVESLWGDQKFPPSS